MKVRITIAITLRRKQATKPHPVRVAAKARLTRGRIQIAVLVLAALTLATNGLQLVVAIAGLR